MINFKAFVFLLFPILIWAETAYTQGDPRAASRGSVIESGSSLIEMGAFTVEQKHNIEGSRYYLDEWLAGEAVFIDNIRSNNIDIKIDTFNDEVHFLSGKDVLALNTKVTKAVYLEKDGEKIVFKTGFNHPSKKIDQNSFLRVIYDGDIKFLARHTSRVRKSNTSVIATSRVLYEYKHYTDYYIQTADKKFHELKRLRKKYVLDSLNGQRKELESFAKENDLNWSKEKDLAKILNYYDQL